MADTSSKQSVPEVVVSYCDADVATGFWDDMFILIWRKDTTVAGVAELQRRFAEFSRGKGRGLAQIIVVVDKASIPTNEARQALATYLEGISDKVVVSAVVHEGSGFFAATVRSIVTGLTMLAQPGYPHRVFKNTEEAAAWMDHTTAVSGAKRFRSKSIIDAVTEFRRRLV